MPFSCGLRSRWSLRPSVLRSSVGQSPPSGNPPPLCGYEFTAQTRRRPLGRSGGIKEPVYRRLRSRWSLRPTVSKCSRSSGPFVSRCLFYHLRPNGPVFRQKITVLVRVRLFLWISLEGIGERKMPPAKILAHKTIKNQE